MSDRISAEFELWARKQGFRDLSQHMGRYCRPVVRHMWAAWQKQAERVSGLIAQLERSHKRSTDLLKQCRDHDARRTAAVAQVAGLAAEVKRLNEIIARLSTEGSNAQEM